MAQIQSTWKVWTGLNSGDFTVTGDTDDDVTFQTNNTQMGVNDLTVTARTITVDSVVSSTDGVLSLTASRNILLNTGSSLTTVDGGITLLANNGGSTAGDFKGISLENAVIQSSGIGNISITGTGGTVDSNYGIYLDSSDISSSSTNVNAGTITVHGTGGTGTLDNSGILLNTSSLISSAYGDIQLTGQGTDGTGAGNVGFMVFNGSEINSTGTGADAATITIEGTAGASTFLGYGAMFHGGTAGVNSIDGNISITGQGYTGAGSTHLGVTMFDTAITSSGTGANAATITINGTGGGGIDYHRGIILTETTVSTIDGDVSLVGQGGR